MQPLDVWYSGGYVQDEWRPRRNLTVTGGLRFDVSMFKNTAYPNPNADALTFRDETGAPVQYSSGELPDTKMLWSPRVGMNWDVAGDQTTQVRGGTGVFTGPPLYVWISNQLGNTGVLHRRQLLEANTDQRVRSTPTPTATSRRTSTGARRASYELNVTDQRLQVPAGVADQHRRRSPAARRHHRHRRSTSTTRTSTASTTSTPTCRRRSRRSPASTPGRAGSGPACAAPTAGPCVNRINNAPAIRSPRRS